MSNRPKPTALKLLQGNPGKRKINPNEPKPDPIVPSCPKHLRGAAKSEWVRITKHLAKLNMVTPVDRAALAMYCQVYGEWAEAIREIDRLGKVYTTKNGNIIQSPYVGFAHRAMELAHKFMVEFGLTPASRARLPVQDTDEDEMKAWEAAAKEHGKKRVTG